MILNTNEFDIHYPGGYSDVFINSSEKIAYKLFISYHHPRLNGTCKEEDGEIKTNIYRKKVFETEREAYELVQASDYLKQFTAEYFGGIHLEKVYDGVQDISIFYLLDCCLKLEYISGECLKTGYLDGTEKLIIKERELNFKLNDIIKHLNRCGVHYTIDSSIILDIGRVKIIDFGTIDPFCLEQIP